LFYRSSAFPLAFHASMAALTLVHSDIVFAALDLFRNVLTHDCLSPNPSRPIPPNSARYAPVIRGVIEKEGFEFIGYLLNGLVGDFPEDSTSTVVSIFRVLSALWSQQVLAWIPPILQHLPTSSTPNQTKTEFLADVTRSANQLAHPTYTDLTCGRHAALSTAGNSIRSNMRSSASTEPPARRGIGDEWRLWALDSGTESGGLCINKW
jgi:transportin-3